MKFEEVLPAMRAGKRVQLYNDVFHLRDGEIYSEGIGPVFRLSDKIVLADDWEILPDPEPEPQWLLLEPGMTIREGDEVFTTDWKWVLSSYRGAKVGSSGCSGPCRRRIAK